MSVFVLTSGGGAPGTTTTALGLTLAWPRPVLLIDADREPTQAVLAGYLGGADPLGRGLSTYALEARETGGVGDVAAHCLALNGQPDRLFLAGFTNPGSARLFEPWWATLLDALSTVDRDVIIDAGRVGGGLPGELAAGADVVAVVARSSLRSIAAQRAYLPVLAEQVGLGHARLELVLVGPDRPYAATEVSEVLGFAGAHVVAWDPERAAVLSDGQAADRRFAKSALAASYVALAERLVAEQRSQRRRLEAASR